MTPITALGSRYGIQGALGRSVKRAAAAGGWWLAGGIPAANCVAAYQAKGAASYAASKVNLANPGTYTISQIYGSEGWDVNIGWTVQKNKMRMVTTAPISDINNRTIAVRSVKAEFGKVFENNGSNQWWHNWNNYSYTRNASTTTLSFTQSLNENHVSIMTANGTYLDGVFIGSGTLGTDAPGVNTCIGNNLSGGLASEVSVAAAAIYNINLSLSQIVALTDAMNAL